MSLRSLYDKYAFIVCIWVYLVQLSPCFNPDYRPCILKEEEWWWLVVACIGDGLLIWYTRIDSFYWWSLRKTNVNNIYLFSGEIHEGLSWCKHLWIHSIFGIILYNMFKQAQKTLRCVTMLHAQVKGQTKDASIWVRDKLRDVKYRDSSSS